MVFFFMDENISDSLLSCEMSSTQRFPPKKYGLLVDEMSHESRESDVLNILDIFT